jgi:hypothetical protein
MPLQNDGLSGLQQKTVLFVETFYLNFASSKFICTYIVLEAHSSVDDWGTIQAGRSRV